MSRHGSWQQPGTQPLADKGRIHSSQIGFIPFDAMANGIRILGGSGSGKTVLAAWFAWLMLLNHRANIIFDPTGSLIDNFLNRTLRYIEHQRLSDAQQAALWDQIIYCDLSGGSGYIMPFSMLRRFGDEPLASVADRIMGWILLGQPESRQASLLGYSAVNKVVRPAATVLATMTPDVQITELADLLTNLKRPTWQTRLDQAASYDSQQTAEAIRFLRDEFSTWQGPARERRLELLESVLSPFRYSPAFRATFGASAPSLDYQEIIAQGKTVLIDASGLEGEYKQLMLNWIFFYSIIAYIKNRGSGRYPPLGLTIDEISTFSMDTPASMELLAQMFGEVVHVLRRQYRLHLQVIHQSATGQLHPQMAAHLASLGNQIIGRPADYESALILAEQLFDYQTLIKRWEPIYFSNRDRDAEIIDYRPLDMSQEEIRHLQARLLMRLDTFRFLARLTRSEGSGQTRLKQLDVSPIVGSFPNDSEISVLRQQLAAQSGVSMQQVLEEIEHRRFSEVKAVDQSAIVPSKHYDDDGYLLPDD